MNKKPVRIGTRASQLAIVQSEKVHHELHRIGLDAEIIRISSKGDLDLKQPLYSFGVTGIFTRSLDIALLNDKIDLAVHSLKDVPTELPSGIIQAAVLERDSPLDVFIKNPNPKSGSSPIATSSLRRKYFWLDRYPEDQIVDVRGNIQTRLNKLSESDWKGIILSKAGLERVGILNMCNYTELHWMLPAPGQGAIMVVCRTDDTQMKKHCTKINHLKTEIETSIERKYLSSLNVGCSSPVGALARIENQQVNFHSMRYVNEKIIEKSTRKDLIQWENIIL